MKRHLLIFLIIFIPLNFFGQGYEIPVKVNHLKDSLIYFGHHYGNGYFVNDSAKLDKNGQAVFKGATKLKGGIYFILLPQSKFFDFLIDKNQQFAITCDTSNFLNTVKFTKSYQNDKFYEYQKYLNQQFTEINLKKESQKRYLTKLDSLMLIEEDIELINNKMYLHKEELIAENPDSLLSVLIKAGLPIMPPPIPKDANGKDIDSLFDYHYTKFHFFDNINFSDERLLQTPILQNKIYEFISQMSVPHYDSIIVDVDKIIARASVNDEIYKFVVNSYFQFFIKSNVLTDENVFVHIADNYYLKGKTPWTTADFTEKLKADIASRKTCLIGQLSPDFQMKDDKGKLLSLRSVKNKFLILYFFDVDCEICQAVTPEMINFYRIIKDRGIDLITIYTGNDKTKWSQYIQEKHLNCKNVWDPDNKSGFREKFKISGTPVIYLLDENQKIIAKNITVDQLMGYFNSIQ